MIPDRSHVLKVLAHAPDGMRADELATVLGADAKGKHRVRRLLADLIESGELEKAPGARYRLAGLAPAPTPTEAAAPGVAHALRPGQVAGRLRVHPAGYGFVVRDDGEDDVFVPARHRGNALDGDRVALSTWLGYKGTEGKVEAILQRGRARLTGVVRGTGRGAHLEPDDPRVQATAGTVVLPEGAGGAREGQAVVAEIVRYPSVADEPLVARVSRVLGEPGDARTEVEKVIACADIPDTFPDEVVQAAERAPDVVTPEDLVDRVDLRDRAFMTIDPETARDFDDAICVEPSPRPGCTRVWVAVADVSHYVRLGQALDREAWTRGCSVYLPDRAIPMLPKKLSAGICSLNPEVDRLAMVVRLEVDAQGGIVDPYFCAAVIRSRARLDYGGVAAALAGDLRGARARYRDFLPALELMRDVAARLRKVRLQRGALDLDLPEAKVLLDEDDPTRVRDVVQSRGDQAVKGAYQLVEDFMLAANEAVARHFRDKGRDTLWRVHDIPSDERLEQFAAVAEAYGLRFDPDEGRSPKRMGHFLTQLRGRPMERQLNFLLLRTLKQATYDIVNVGHFGLGAPDYLHFTSPIRRYPDLVVHRLLKHALHADGLPAGGKPSAPPTRGELAQIAADSSSNERRAMEAEREVIDLYRALFMRDRVGEVLDGTIAGVAAFGFFVQVESPFIEGLVRLEALPQDGYELDESGVRLTGRRSGHAYQLGDVVRVRVENVSVERRKIDFALESHERAAPAARAKGGGRSLKARLAEEKARRGDRGVRRGSRGDGPRGRSGRR